MATGAPTTPAAAGLDWQAFCATYFPGRHRHDLEALVAYGAYRRSSGVENGAGDAAALEAREDEGGPAI